MNKIKYYFIHITLASMSIAWIIQGITLLFFLDGGDIGSEVFRILVYIFTSLTFLLALGLTLSFLTRMGKEYWKTYGKREYAVHRIRKKKQRIKELQYIDYSLLKKYEGKNIFIVKGRGFLWIMIVLFMYITSLFVLLETVDGSYNSSIIWISYITILLVMFIWYLRLKVRIDENGVSLIKGNKVSKTLKWGKIKSIGISLNIFGYSSIFGFMYISTRTLKGEPIFDQYIEKNYLVLLKPSPQAIHCILKYWDNGIKNLDTQKNWYKYINRL